MLKLANVATPLTALTGPPPASVPPPGFALRASVIGPVKLVTLLSEASSALTLTAGVIVAPTCVLVGGTLKPRCVAGGGVPAATTKSTGTRAGLPTACAADTDRKSTRLNSSHVAISYAVFCLKKKKKIKRKEK